MLYAAKGIVLLIGILHCYFLWLEMFAWTTKARKIFKSIPQEQFLPTKTMAANQGLYNGFLAAGLFWSLFITDPNWSANISLFFLACVLLAGIFGGISASKKIFYVQGLPALVGLLLWVALKYIA